jgi:ligand-binding sensor domain-containing protein
MKLSAAVAAAVIGTIAACGGDGGIPDGGPGLRDAGGISPGDAGGADAADSDAPDAGDDDAGADADAGEASDAGSAADPVRAECANQTGDANLCWFEWLKDVRPTGFTPVERGALGAGPWPTTAIEVWGAAERIIGVGVDTGQNVYAVSREALYVRRAGAAQFERYARGTSGLRDYPLLSVAGAGPGVAYVGYEGVFGLDPDNEPAAVRKSGDLGRIELRSGGIEAFSYETHNSNAPVSGKYDHTRSIFEIVVPRRGPAAGEVFLGTEHGLVRYQGELYVDHVHIETLVNGTQRFGPSRALAVGPDGTAWYGNDFQFGGRPWTLRRAEWLQDARWKFPSTGYGAVEERDYYTGIDVDAAGNVWAAARTFGLVQLVVSPSGRAASTLFHSVPDANLNELVVDADQSVWIATDGGLYRRDAVSGEWAREDRVKGGAFDLFLDDTVAPRALYVASGDGVAVLRGP